MLFDLPTIIDYSASVDSQPTEPVLSKADIALTTAFPKIEQGKDYPYATGGEWSAHDMIFHFLKFTGPAHLTAATWTISERAAIDFKQHLDAGQFLSVNLLVDWRCQIHTPALVAIAKNEFTTFRLSSCHAKTYVLQNQNWSISFVSSANFTNNPRIEAGHISTNPDISHFHKSWIMAEIEKAEPFGVDMRRFAGRLAFKPDNSNTQ